MRKFYEERLGHCTMSWIEKKKKTIDGEAEMEALRVAEERSLL